MSPNAALQISGLAALCALGNPGVDVTDTAPSLEQVATLHTARAAHTVTALRSGQVLIVGGMNENGASLKSVEIYQPSDNSVREIAPLKQARVSHSATLLRDGRVLIAGGYNGDYLSSIEIFDAAASSVQSAGSLSEGRSGHTATLLPDGRVLFVGGIGRGWTYLRTAEIYDPATRRSEIVASMSVPRESHTATLLADGRVLVVGGHSGRRPNVELYASAEVFSPANRRFEAAGSLVTARHKHDAVKLPDGRVLIIGGADRSDRVHFATTEIYDARTSTFESGPTMAERRYKIAGTSILLPSGELLITAGARTPELLDTKRMAFRKGKGNFPAAYRFAAATQLPGGGAIITGGYSDRNQTARGVWRFR